MPQEQPFDVSIQIELGDDASPDEIDSGTRHLVREINDSGVGDAKLEGGGTAPAGAKGTGGGGIGDFSISVLPDAIKNLCSVLSRWLGAVANRRIKLSVCGEGRKIAVELPMGAVPPERLAELIKMALERPSGGSPKSKA